MQVIAGHPVMAARCQATKGMLLARFPITCLSVAHDAAIVALQSLLHHVACTHLSSQTNRSVVVQARDQQRAGVTILRFGHCWQVAPSTAVCIAVAIVAMLMMPRSML